MVSVFFNFVSLSGKMYFFCSKFNFDEIILFYVIYMEIKGVCLFKQTVFCISKGFGLIQFNSFNKP